MNNHRNEMNLVSIGTLGLDAFEQGLLVILRHFQSAVKGEEPNGWFRAYNIAAERWGEGVGLSVSHALFKVLRATNECAPYPLDCIDPFAIQFKKQATEQEASFMKMIHFMRRDNTKFARLAVETLTDGLMDPHVIRSGLSFASRFPSGQHPKTPSCGSSHLSLVS